MQENVPRNVETPASTRSRKLWQTLVAVVTAIMAIGLIIVFVGAVKSQPGKLSPSLRVVHGALKSDEKSGKLVWSGTVLNEGKQVADSPWIRVTIYDPAGDSVDVGEATATEGTIPAGGALTYTRMFDTRGPDLRQKAVLETPNSNGLGM